MTEKGIEVMAMEKLLKEMESLKISTVAKDSPTSSRYMDRWCIWCDSTEHYPKDCCELKEALQRDLIYYEGNWIHSMDTRKPRWPNFQKGGMKKVLEDAISVKINYATTKGIRVGEISKANASFWLEVLEISEKNDSNEIQSTSEKLGDGSAP